MNNVKLLFSYFKERPVAIVTTLAGTLCGACFGAIAYFQNWLG